MDHQEKAINKVPNDGEEASVRAGGQIAHYQLSSLVYIETVEDGRKEGSGELTQLSAELASTSSLLNSSIAPDACLQRFPSPL